MMGRDKKLEIGDSNKREIVTGAVNRHGWMVELGLNLKLKA
jgi:hypothetical protein